MVIIYVSFLKLAKREVDGGLLKVGIGPQSKEGAAGVGVPGDLFGSWTELCFFVTDLLLLGPPGSNSDGLKSSSGNAKTFGRSGFLTGVAKDPPEKLDGSENSGAAADFVDAAPATSDF